MPVRVTKQIKKLCEQIARDFHPDKMILFGSHAYGHAGPDADVDLLVSERLAMGDFFIREITEQGQVVYEADHKIVD